MHGSQKIKEKTENGAIISIEVIPNFELITQILGMGEGVEILESGIFRERIHKVVSALYEKYN